MGRILRVSIAETLRQRAFLSQFDLIEVLDMAASIGGNAAMQGYAKLRQGSN